jgi:hypothetical protein
MGYHADVYKGIADLVIGALPSNFPVFDALTVGEQRLSREARSVCILRESVDYTPHVEINPDTSVQDQWETWSWALYIKGGAGQARPPARGAEVDLYLEMIRTALNAQRPTSHCGPLYLVSEEFEGRDGATVAYTQRWTHRRLE